MDRPAHQIVLSILVPTYRDDIEPLITALCACKGAEQTHLIVFDDGSGDDARIEMIEALISEFPGRSELIASQTNLGRAEARNRLLEAATTDWVVLLDADMVPNDRDFLAQYIKLTDTLGRPTLVCGGSSTLQVAKSAATALHLAQSEVSECLDAAIRSKDPGRYVFTSNILVHRTIFTRVTLDPGYVGWGWEDVDWGLSILHHFPILHINNTASHLGLLTDKGILEKYQASGANFARLAHRHPDRVADMPLYRAARLLKFAGVFRAPLIYAARRLTESKAMPIRARLLSLKLFRALIYSRDIE